MNKYVISLLFHGTVVFITLNSCVALAGTGNAVHYHDKYQGKKTAYGEVFDQNKLTAAHNKLPYGSQVKVTNLANNQVSSSKLMTAWHNIMRISSMSQNMQLESWDFLEKGARRSALKKSDK